MAYACKTSSARSIVGVIPYLPYSKQCNLFIYPFLVYPQLCQKDLQRSTEFKS